MGSREKILEKISQYKAKVKPLPDLSAISGGSDVVTEFISILEKIGGKAVEVKNLPALEAYVVQHRKGLDRIVSTIPGLPWTVSNFSSDPHTLEDVDLAILKGHFGVAENGAIWITDDLMGDRALPFIAQNLALVIEKNSIVPTLLQAYEKIENTSFNYATFIAGPSKTADIEQSLVLGAHGPKSLTVFLMDSF